MLTRGAEDLKPLVISCLDDNVDNCPPLTQVSKEIMMLKNVCSQQAGRDGISPIVWWAEMSGQSSSQQQVSTLSVIKTHVTIGEIPVTTRSLKCNHPEHNTPPQQKNSRITQKCTDNVKNLIQCECCEMWLCSKCEKVPSKVIHCVGQHIVKSLNKMVEDIAKTLNETQSSFSNLCKILENKATAPSPASAMMEVGNEDEESGVASKPESYSSVVNNQVVTSLTTQLEEMTISSKELRRENDILQIHNDGLKVEVDSLKEEVDGLKVENNSLKEEVDGLKVEVDGLKVENSGLKEEVDGLKVKKCGLNAGVDALKLENNGLNMENTRLKTKVKNEATQLKVNKRYVQF
ncbi:testis-specific gene 10 protein-like [Dysidea avara]|uniref:testis-specific gene 10 protein-like n=1 Tax=Dysidea avara TaxID=196820 RepID=UPI00332DAC76